MDDFVGQMYRTIGQLYMQTQQADTIIKKYKDLIKNKDEEITLLKEKSKKSNHGDK